MKRMSKKLQPRAQKSPKYPSIPKRTVIYMAYRNLTHHKLRTMLTLVGIVIGIGSIYFLLSFGLGLRQLVTNQVIGNQSLKSIDVSTQNSKIIKLDDTVYSKIRNLPHVARAGATYAYAGSIQVKGGEADAIVYGPDVNYQTMDNLILAKGCLLKRNDQGVMLVNRVALRSININDASDAIGKKYRCIFRFRLLM